MNKWNELTIHFRETRIWRTDFGDLARADILTFK